MVISKLANGNFVQAKSNAEMEKTMQEIRKVSGLSVEGKIMQYRSRMKGSSIDMPAHFQKAANKLRKAGQFYRYRDQ